jgi:hypothetical protein
MSALLGPDGRPAPGDSIEQRLAVAEEQMNAQLARAVFLPDGGRVVLTDDPQPPPKGWVGLAAMLDSQETYGAAPKTESPLLTAARAALRHLEDRHHNYDRAWKDHEAADVATQLENAIADVERGQ